MEVRVHSPQRIFEHFPDGSVLSVRCGSTRRQAPVKALHDHPLKFPTKCDGASPLRIDILTPHCRQLQQVLAPHITEYDLHLKDLAGDGIVQKVKISVTSNDEVGASHAAEAVDGSKVKYEDAAKQARGYLEHHQLLDYFQSLLHACIQERPEDPFLFMYEQIGSFVRRNLEGASGDANVSAVKALRAEDEKKWQVQLQQVEKAEEIRVNLEKVVKALTERIQKVSQDVNQRRSDDGEGAINLQKEIDKLTSQLVSKEDQESKQKEQESKLNEAIEQREALAVRVQDLATKLLGVQSAREERLSEEAATPGAASEEIAKLPEEIASLKAQPASIGGSPDEVEKLKKVLEDQLKQLETAEERGKQLQGSMKLLQDRVGKLTSEESLKRLKAAEDKGEDMKTRMEELKGRVGKLSSGESAPSEESFKRLEEAEGKGKEMEDRMKLLQEQVQAVKRVGDDAAAPVVVDAADLQRLKESEDKRVKLEKSVDVLKKRLEAALGAGGVPQSTVDGDMLSKLDAADKKRELLAKSLTDLNSRVGVLQLPAAGTSGAVVDAEALNKLTQAEELRTALEKRVADLGVRVDSLSPRNGPGAAVEAGRAIAAAAQAAPMLAALPPPDAVPPPAVVSAIAPPAAVSFTAPAGTMATAPAAFATAPAAFATAPAAFPTTPAGPPPSELRPAPPPGLAPAPMVGIAAAPAAQLTRQLTEAALIDHVKATLEKSHSSGQLGKSFDTLAKQKSFDAGNAPCVSDENLVKIEATRQQLKKGLEAAFENGILNECLKDAGVGAQRSVPTESMGRVGEALSKVSSGKVQTELAQFKDVDSIKKKMLEQIETSHSSGQLSSNIARTVSVDPKNEKAMTDLKILKETFTKELQAKASDGQLEVILEKTDYGVTVAEANEASSSEKQRMQAIEAKMKCLADELSSQKDQVSRIQKEMEEVKREKDNMKEKILQQGASTFAPGDRS